MLTDKTVVLLADTHVPDRADRLDPVLLEAVAREKPDLIFHAGDVCDHATIEVLEAIAPVSAVMGNRDWILNHRLPLAVRVAINGVNITLTHGHISMFHYLFNYILLFVTLSKKSHRYYQKQLARQFPDADIIVYGHTHFQVDEIQNGIRFINPGSALPQKKNHYKINFSVLIVRGDGACAVIHRALTPTPRAASGIIQP